MELRKQYRSHEWLYEKFNQVENLFTGTKEIVIVDF